MTVDAYDMTARDADPLYKQGRTHMQAGHWPQAIRSFEELAGRHPEDAGIAALLEEARFKARLEHGSRVRGKRWIIPWRRIVLSVIVVALLAYVVIQGASFVNRQLAPSIAQARFDQQVADLLDRGKQNLAAEEFVAAGEAYQALIALIHNNPGAKADREKILAEAQAGLDTIQAQRAIVDLYKLANTHYDSGDYAGALKLYTELLVRAPAGYRDVSMRIAEIKRQGELDTLFGGAEADMAAERYPDALLKYEQIQQLSATYKKEIITGRLFALYLLQGRQIVEARPPALDQVPIALELFKRAAALQPNNTQAALERQLADYYLAGQAAFKEQRWADAVTALSVAYGQRPDYLAGALVPPLYDAYIRNGDILRDRQDIPAAWEQYRRASELPGVDVVMARARMASVAHLMTPTPTPTPTPTTTPMPTIDLTALVRSLPLPPTPKATGTPPAPLASYRNQIVFVSAHDDQPGFWVMSPDGTNRRYLGRDSGTLRKQYDELRAKEIFSPDGYWRVYNYKSHADLVLQIYIQATVKNQFDELDTKELTGLSKFSYDPVWAPDGSRIAFVGTEKGSDDIWTMRPDGTDLWNRTPNVWEWDKHPSWAPDSQRLVFWTNREGTKQIYIMDLQQGSIPQYNISKVAWDEYDPIWIK